MALLETIEALLRVRRIPRGMVVVEWRVPMPPASGFAEQKLVQKLSETIRRDMELPPTFVLPVPEEVQTITRPDAPEDFAQLRRGGLTLSRRFVGNAELRTDVLGQWIRKHWFPLMDCFEGEIKPTFLALILQVEMSTEGILERGEERQLLARYLKKFPGWDDLADAEFRVSKVVTERFFLNFGLSTYRTFELQAQMGTVLPSDGSPGQQLALLHIEPPKEKDRGIKVQVDANTKVNILEGKGEIVVTKEDLATCLELAKNSIDNELGPFLRMSE